MIFKLTDEQIEEILYLYGGSKRTIKAIEFKLNYLGVIDDYDDYVEIVKAVLSQHQSVQAQLENSGIKYSYSNIENLSKLYNVELARVYMSLDEIIELELKRMYENIDHKYTELQKALSK